MSKPNATDNPDYVKLIESTKACRKHARNYLRHINLNASDEVYKQHRKDLDNNLLLRVIVNRLEPFDIPEMRIKPDASADPKTNPDSFTSTEAQRWENYLTNIEICASIFIIIESNQLLKDLKYFEDTSIYEKRIPIQHVGEIAEAYSKILLARMVINLPTSAKQHAKDISKRDRTDRLGELMHSFILSHAIHGKEDIIGYLYECVGGGIIESVSDENIEWIDKKGNIRDAPITGLRSRISRLKKKVK
jgi:hypothetical protein